MAEKSTTASKAVRKNDIAKPLHLQRLEAALDIRHYMNYMDKIFEKEPSSDGESSSEDSQISDDDLSQGNKIVHGVVTTKEGIFCSIVIVFVTVYFSIINDLICQRFRTTR